VVFRLRVSGADLRRMRFAYSPLAEMTESLCMLSRGRLPEPYHGWFETVRPSLRRVDMPLLREVVPPRCEVARFMFLGAGGVGIRIEEQLQLVAEYPADLLRRDLGEVWHGEGLPPEAQRLLSDGGTRRLADALWEYWQVAISPHWSSIRALMEADVAYRGARLADGGMECLLADLHPRIKLHDHALQIGSHGPVHEHDLSGTGLLLVPSVFAWPYLDVSVGNPWPPHLVYGARGVGNLWHDQPHPATDTSDVLGELLGRSRAAILICVALPKSTTDLARELGQSPPAVSAHLSVLRRSGLVTSFRSGRRVLYQRTPIATSLIAGTGASRQAG
jgi:DNA-binding transcriptional ArsR family regulator